MIEITGVVLPQGNRHDSRDLFTINIYTTQDGKKHAFAVRQGDGKYLCMGNIDKEFSAHQNIFHVLGNLLGEMEDQEVIGGAGSNYLKRGGYKNA